MKSFKMNRDLSHPEVLAVLHQAKVDITRLTGRNVKVWCIYDLPADSIPLPKIVKDCADELGVELSVITSSSRERRLVDIRNCIVYFLRQKTSKRDAEIAAVFNKERTFCCHGFDCARNLIMQGNDEFMDVYFSIAKVFKSYDRLEAVSQ
jgi:chromosomal replication initiation ATPase DnaA